MKIILYIIWALFAGQPVPGTLVEIAYNPANPNESFHVSSRTKTTLGCLIPFFAVLALASSGSSASFPWPDSAWPRQLRDTPTQGTTF